MKRKAWIWGLGGLLLLAVFFTPIPTGVCQDGGSRVYSALTYKIVDWNRLTEDSVYSKTRVYFFPDNLKSIDSLWHYEEDKVEHSFIATVLETDGSTALVQPVADSALLDKVAFGIGDLEDIGAQAGSVVKITYTGSVMESYPAQIDAVRWQISKDLRHLEYTEQWLDKETAEKTDPIFDHIVITEIYSNCFFARTVIPMPYTIKLNGQLSKDWCVGDQIRCTYKNAYYDVETDRVEADMLTVEASDWEPDPFMCYKPVIYLYPETEAKVSVRLDLKGKLTCTYPAYNDGWKVTAAPDGTLMDEKGQTYNYLYWEGLTNARWDMRRGFCVKGEDTAAFLEEALAKLGLTRREANEFIVYWLPLMQDNPYNIISFQTDNYTDAAGLRIDPQPDSLIRVFMAWQASDVCVEMEEQELKKADRFGFTVVEWGGTEVR